MVIEGRVHLCDGVGHIDLCHLAHCGAVNELSHRCRLSRVHINVTKPAHRSLSRLVLVLGE